MVAAVAAVVVRPAALVAHHVSAVQVAQDRIPATALQARNRAVVVAAHAPVHRPALVVLAK